MRPTAMRTRGMTILEVLVATALVGAILALAMGSVVDTNKFVGDTTQQTDIRNRDGRAIELVTRELRSAKIDRLDGAALSPVGSFTSVRFNRVEGYDVARGAPVLGPRMEIRFEYDAGEAGPSGKGDGIDNDKDGLVDEGSLVLYRDANADGDTSDQGERVGVLARGVANTFGLWLASGAQTPQTNDTELCFFVSVQGRKQSSTEKSPIAASQTARIGLRN